MHKEIAKPGFLIVGAAKCGTTSLFHYLNEHPKIFIPEIKECRYFSQLGNDHQGLGAEYFVNTGISDENGYLELFKNQKDKLCGDISNDYLYYYERSIPNIKKLLGEDVKIIIILRNPVDRAYSNYMHSVRDGWEDSSFEEAIIKEPLRIQKNWAWPYHYVNVGRYFKQVKSYLDNFKNVKIYLFEDLKNKQEFMNSLFSFLKLEPISYGKERKEYNISGYPKNKLFHSVITNNKFKNTFRPMVKKYFSDDLILRIKSTNLEKKIMSDESRYFLVKQLKNDVKDLGALIKRDLSGWLRF